jgi:hypothetical protein
MTAAPTKDFKKSYVVTEDFFLENKTHHSTEDSKLDEIITLLGDLKHLILNKEPRLTASRWVTGPKHGVKKRRAKTSK